MVQPQCTVKTENAAYSKMIEHFNFAYTVSRSYPNSESYTSDTDH
jgi:hypothetical protein